MSERYLDVWQIEEYLHELKNIQKTKTTIVKYYKNELLAQEKTN